MCESDPEWLCPGSGLANQVGIFIISWWEDPGGGTERRKLESIFKHVAVEGVMIGFPSLEMSGRQTGVSF